MKNLLFLLFLWGCSSSLFSQIPVIREARGWLESAYVTWTPLEGVSDYVVSWTGEGKSDQVVDPQLIRFYGDYYRADVPGLKAGTYTLKVAALLEGGEGSAAETQALEVEAHDRTGFAFANGRVPGAYRADGTAKEGAVVLYVTEQSKNTVSMDVSGANANPCVGIQEILDGFKKGNDNRPLIVRFIGQITDPDYLLNGDVVVENKNNASSYITLEGVGDDAVADGWGIRLKNASNVEIRNLGTMNCDSGEGDNIGLQQNNDYIWVHHCDFFYGEAGGDADQAKGDGALDAKRSTYITFSYNHFWDSGKANLLGLGESTTEGLYATYHHNWFDHSDSRHPRVRFFSVHVYNNYYDGVSKYGVGVTSGGSVFVEGNYFRNAKYPMLISQQGSDVYSGTGTFSGEDGGIIKAFNNYVEGAARFVPYGATGFANSTLDFDAWVADEATASVPADVKTKKGGHSYNNFDTNPELMYAYTADAPELARDKVKTYAGRMFGGDFQWSFNDAADDASYAVNLPLKQALLNYTTALVSVQGEDALGGGPGNGDDEQPGNGEEPGNGVVLPGDYVHNFTLSGMESTFYSIVGNLSDSKGTVNYGALVLTQCLKMESSTHIAFTMEQPGVLILVFNEGESKRVYVDGSSYTYVDGLLELPLEAGEHTITKHDVANLFYMSVDMGLSTSLRQEEAATLSISPNPVQSIVHIRSSAPVDGVALYGLSGVRLGYWPGSVQELSLQYLSAGTYVLVVNTREGVLKELLLKQ